jgi:hypothetical protein
MAPTTRAICVPLPCCTGRNTGFPFHCYSRADFPAEVLKAFGIEPQSPDEFVLNLLDLAPGAVAAIVSRQAADLKSPPHTRDQLLETLIANGLVRSVAKLRELFA